MANRKLGRTSPHRAALFRNQLSSIIANERIITTLVKAKELRPIVEKMVTLAKNDSVHARRLAARDLADELVSKLFTAVGPRFVERPGGYTRIVKLGPRRGDGAEMAILEFVDFEPALTPAPPAEKDKKAAKKSQAPHDESAKEANLRKKEAKTEEKKAAKEARETKKAAKPKSGAKKTAAKKTAAKKTTAKKSAPKKSTTSKPKKGSPGKKKSR